MEWVRPVVVLRPGKSTVLVVTVVGASTDAVEIAPRQSVSNCVRDIYQGVVERFFRRSRIDTLLEILLVMFLELAVLFYGFDGWTPQYLPVDGDVEDRFHEDLEINENAGIEIFTNVVIVIFVRG